MDHATMGQAFSGPGQDTRQWCSYGTVDREHGDQKSVRFTKEYGPLVQVTLHPSAISVTCRVAGAVAGAGEGEWYPFLEGDEVLVAIPEGDERAGCCIIGRLNQEIDQFPTTVAGADVSANNFGFRRVRAPFIIETASNFLIRSAATGAFFGIKDGALTLGNAENAFLHLGADFLGFQTGDAKSTIQLLLEKNQVLLEAAGTRLLLDADASTFQTGGTLSIGTGGVGASGHAVTLEQVVCLLANVLAAMAMAGVFPAVGVGSTWAAPLWSAGAPALLKTVLGAALKGATSPTPFGAAGLPGGDMTLVGVAALVSAALASQGPDPAATGLPAPELPGVGRQALML